MSTTTITRCDHPGATGITATDPSDPAKVWRCDECGALFRSITRADGITEQVELTEAEGAQARRAAAALALFGAVWDLGAMALRLAELGVEPLAGYAITDRSGWALPRLLIAANSRASEAITDELGHPKEVTAGGVQVLTWPAGGVEVVMHP